MFSGENRRPAIVLLTSAVCLTAWHLLGNYNFGLHHRRIRLSVRRQRHHAGNWMLLATVLLLGIVPLLIVKLVLGERWADYGIRWGNLQFAAICSLLAVPLIVLIGYCSSQSPAFQAVYPINPARAKSATNLAMHLVEQLSLYAAWEFHFRGFLQHALQKQSGIATAIWVQTLASTLAHFGKPAPEVFASIVGGVLWAHLPGAHARCWPEFSNTGCWARRLIFSSSVRRLANDRQDFERFKCL